MNEETPPAPQKYGRVVVDDEKYAQVVKFVKKQRSHALSREERLDILLAQATLRHDHYLAQKKAGEGKKIKNANATETVTRLLGRTKRLALEVWNSFWVEQDISVSLAPANRARKTTVVPQVVCVVASVQRFVRERREQHIRTVARDVMEHLINMKFISVQMDNAHAYRAALRAVQRFLKRLGYKRGVKRGAYKLSSENEARRDAFVLDMRNALASNSRLVFLDESYIHKNYARHDDSLYDPNDGQDLQVRVKHKGERYCFIAAIISADIAATERADDELAQAHLMRDTLHIFKGGSKQTKDYHGMFNHSYFTEWMERLLVALDARKIQGAVIIMDNARYHTKKPEGTPKGNWRKDAIVAACRERGIVVGATETKAMLWIKLKEHIKLHTKSVMYDMAAARGHKVLYTPPYHSDLQPIETVWAIVKGEVGRQYTTQTTMGDVLARLERAFENLRSETVAKCIDKSLQCLEELRQHIAALQVDEGDADSESSDCEEAVSEFESDSD